MSAGAVRHAFAVPAYGRSPHLPDCLASLQAQRMRSTVFVCTSTPYEGLQELVESFGARLIVHGPNRGIGHDWNEALKHVQADWVTLAHQDDVYLPHFAADTVAAIARHPDAKLVLTGYGELLGEQARTWTPMLAIKRVLLELGFLGREAVSGGSAKRRPLRFGCPIPCPSVTLRRPPDGALFREDMKLNLDWDAWLRLASGPGAFVYLRRTGMLHRIHAASETSEGVRGGARASEDRMMFESLWPKPIAALLARVYAASYEAGQ